MTSTSILVAAFTFFAVPVHSYRDWTKYLNDEGRLMVNLTRGKYPYFRPVSRKEENINVTIRFIQLLYINELDVKKGFLSAEMLIGMKWTAPDLSWDIDEFAGIDTIHIPAKRVWVPDLSLYNGGSDSLKLTKTTTIVSSEGLVLWTVPAQVKISCELYMRLFPNDRHACTLIFGSWVYNANEVDFNIKSELFVRGDLPQSEWSVTSSTIKRHFREYECCPEPYVSIEVNFELGRRSTVLSYVYVSPLVIMALLSPFMFSLPYQQTQRFALGGSLLICLILLLVNLDHVFPTTFSGLPFISIWYMSVIVMLILAMVASAIILNLAEKMTEPHPLLKRILVQGLGCVLFVKSKDYINLVKGDEEYKARKSDDITWRYIAAVLDRFFFTLLIVSTLAILIALVTAPYS